MIEPVVGHADGVLSGVLIELDHDGVAVAIVGDYLVDQLRGDIVAVHRVDPHSMTVDSELQTLEATGIDECQCCPTTILLRVDGDQRHLTIGRCTSLVGCSW